MGMAASVELSLLQVVRRANASCCQMPVHDSQPMGGTLNGGTQQTDMAIAAEHLLKARNNLEKSLRKIQVNRSKKCMLMRNVIIWMSAQETLEYGFIDEIMANNKLG